MKNYMKLMSLGIFGVQLGCAATPVLTTDSYADNEQAETMIDRLVTKESFDRDYLQTLMKSVQRDDTILEKISRPAEKTKPWYKYKQIFLDEARIRNGVSFYLENQKWLEKAQVEYGVDPAIIVAIIGVETRYGKMVGKTPVLSALTTLCFDYPPRAKFFCGELEKFLILARQQDWQPLDIQGSYAGAVGMAQFMPSSYSNDAVDYDEDGKIDLWHSNADAIGSIARYLSVRGWEKGGKIVYQLPERPALDEFGQSYQLRIPLYLLKEDKALRNNSMFQDWLSQQPNDIVGDLVLEEQTGESYWLTYNNFRVIMLYNTSPLYAMAVTMLAQEIQNLLTVSPS